MKIGSKDQVSCQKILEITLGDVPFDCYVCVCVCVCGGGGVEVGVDLIKCRTF